MCDSICNYDISKSTCHILPAAKNIYLPPMYALIFKMVSLITLMLHYSWTEIVTKQQAVLQKLLPRPQLQTRPTEIWEIKERLLLPWKCSRLARSRFIKPCCWNINLLEDNISTIHNITTIKRKCFTIVVSSNSLDISEIKWRPPEGHSQPSQAQSEMPMSRLHSLASSVRTGGWDINGSYMVVIVSV